MGLRYDRGTLDDKTTGRGGSGPIYGRWSSPEASQILRVLIPDSRAMYGAKHDFKQRELTTLQTLPIEEEHPMQRSCLSDPFRFPSPRQGEGRLFRSLKSAVKLCRDCGVEPRDARIHRH